MDADTLHTLVSSAIWRAEQLEDRGIPAAAAWAEVSQLEEELAKVFPHSEPEGKIARRGAVRAALEAGEFGRAHALFERFSAEEKAPRDLKAALKQILAESTEALAQRYPYAARRYPLAEAREVAARLREAGPFGLARVA